MALDKDFFAEFPTVSKEEWLRQIAKDLKGRPLEELDWALTGDWKVSPFAHADDFAQPPLPLSGIAIPWELCEEIAVNDVTAANRQAMEALEGGAEGLRFHLNTVPGAASFDLLFEGIHPDFIGLHFSGQGVVQNPGAVLGNLEGLARQKNLPTELLHGSLQYDPAASNGIVDWRYLADLALFAKEKFPHFRLVTIAIGPPGSAMPSGTSANGTSSTPEKDLEAGLRRGNLYLQKLTERGLSAAEAAAAVQFSVAVGKSYFLEIARIRAFKLLWLNVLKAWGAPLHQPVIEADFQPEAYSDDLYTNMIRATTMAMSAVLGGAERLTVLPYDAGREARAGYSPAFGRRIARNVQHLLKMESFLGEVPDPAAGSYYIEQLTGQLAERGWAAFQKG